MDIFGPMTGYGNGAGFRRMSELAVASSHSIEMPTIPLDDLDNLADLHVGVCLSIYQSSVPSVVSSLGLFRVFRVFGAVRG